MTRRQFASTPQWLKVVAALGALTTVVVAWRVGLQAAVVTAAITLVALGADRALPEKETD